MNSRRLLRTSAKVITVGIVVVLGSYATYVGMTWLRYGKPRPASPETADTLLTVFMPAYDVVDRHSVRIAAPASVALDTAAETDLENSRLIRTIFRTREFLLGSEPNARNRHPGFIEDMLALGWGRLADLPGREVVMGAVTKPWEANPVFRALPPDEFAAFNEPDYVKIVWTLRADSTGNADCVFRTETRAVATDAEARRKFRKYWAFLSPGIIVIRRVILPHIKSEAERRQHALRLHPETEL